MKKIISIFILLFSTGFIFAQVYKNNVTVSYYGEAFNGKKTSNGEIFNMNSFTCAHKTLPFNTELKITNLSNGKSVKVRVNDRGPFVVGREVDLSKAAATQIGMLGTGTCKARIEIVKLGPNTKLSQQTAASAARIMAKKGEKISTALPVLKKQTETAAGNSKKTAADPDALWDIQIGAYGTREAANKVAQKLLKQGFTDVVFQKTAEVTRVVIKAVKTEKLTEIEQKLQDFGYTDFVVKQRKA